jgi:CRISPR-associated endoribonuclease Cas6
MRVRLVFNLKNKGANVPFHHQSLLTDFIVKFLQKTPYEGYDFLSFSGLKGQTKVSRLGLQFYSSKITLVLSSPNQKFIDYLISRIFKEDEIRIGNLVLKPDFVEREEDPEFANSTKYVCISPTVITDNHTDNYEAKKFVSPEEDAFSDLLYEITMKRMELSGAYTSEQIASFYKFQIVPDKVYLQKIKNTDKKFARIYTIQYEGKRYEFRGYTLPFTLYALPEVQRFVFECGLGSFTTQGFGMIDIANSDPIKRASLYPLELVHFHSPNLQSSHLN